MPPKTFRVKSRHLISTIHRSDQQPHSLASPIAKKMILTIPVAECRTGLRIVGSPLFVSPATGTYMEPIAGNDFQNVVVMPPRA